MTHENTPPIMAKKYRFSSENRRVWQEKSTDFLNQRALLPFVTTRVRRCQRALSRAILLPSRHGLSSPYMTYLLRAFAPMAGIAQQLYAVSVISLRSQCRPRWVLPHVPSRLRPDGNPPLQHAATRRHRTQTMQFLPISGIFLSQSIVLCERIRKPSVHAGLRTFIFKIAGSGNAY